MAGLKEFKEKMLEDSAFTEEVRKLRIPDEVVAFAAEHGYEFTEQEIEELTDLSEEDIAKVYGGVRVLVGTDGMANKDIARHF